MTKNNELEVVINAVKDAYSDSELDTAIKHVGMAFTDVFTAGVEFLELVQVYADEYTKEANTEVNINKVMREKANKGYEAPSRDEKLDIYYGLDGLFDAADKEFRKFFGDK